MTLREIRRCLLQAASYINNGQLCCPEYYTPEEIIRLRKNAIDAWKDLQMMPTPAYGEDRRMYNEANRYANLIVIPNLDMLAKEARKTLKVVR